MRINKGDLVLINNLKGGFGSIHYNAEYANSIGISMSTCITSGSDGFLNVPMLRVKISNRVVSLFADEVTVLGQVIL